MDLFQKNKPPVLPKNPGVFSKRAKSKMAADSILKKLTFEPEVIDSCIKTLFRLNRSLWPGVCPSVCHTPRYCIENQNTSSCNQRIMDYGLSFSDAEDLGKSSGNAPNWYAKYMEMRKICDFDQQLSVCLENGRPRLQGRFIKTQVTAESD